METSHPSTKYALILSSSRCLFFGGGGLVSGGRDWWLVPFGAKVMHAELLETSFQEQFQIKAASLDLKGQLGCSMACLRVRRFLAKGKPWFGQTELRSLSRKNCCTTVLSTSGPILLLRQQQLFAEVAAKLEGKRLRELLPERIEAWGHL